jgi:ComF family protein
VYHKIFVMKFLNAFLDILFPPSKHEESLAGTRLSDFNIEPILNTVSDIKIISLTSYQDKRVKNLIRLLKYNGSQVATTLCAEIIEDFLREEISDVKEIDGKKVFVTAVPLGTIRQKERGFNQVELILEKLESAKSLNAAISYDLLIRARDTKPQTSLSREERIKNVERAFTLTDIGKSLPKNSYVIIIDDVSTTGATLASASIPFIERGISVLPMSIAHG